MDAMSTIAKVARTRQSILNFKVRSPGATMQNNQLSELVVRYNVLKERLRKSADGIRVWRAYCASIDTTITHDGNDLIT